jgi:hypothetical protein
LRDVSQDVSLGHFNLFGPLQAVNDTNTNTNIKPFMSFQKSISCLQSLIIRRSRHIIAIRTKTTPVNSCVIDDAVIDKQLPDIKAIIHNDANKSFMLMCLNG